MSQPALQQPANSSSEIRNPKSDRILILGACGQIGVELTASLRSLYGGSNVFATDLQEEHPLLAGTGPFSRLDATDTHAVHEFIVRKGITQVYLLAALLSATGEKMPARAWDINMRSLLQLLEIGVQEKLAKIYWPSTIAVFGPTTPRQDTPQHTVTEPVTVYGISKWAGELWCQYYHERWGLDVRSLRYPGLISWKAEPGGGTTDYAVDIYHKALSDGAYTCFLKEDTALPMMYMDDAIRGTLELMEAPAHKLSTRMAYNFSALSFTPAQIADSIRTHLPEFQMAYEPDFRQGIAEGWPQSIDDSLARQDWGWAPRFDLEAMTADMLQNLKDR